MDNTYLFRRAAESAAESQMDARDLSRKVAALERALVRERAQRVQLEQRLQSARAENAAVQAARDAALRVAVWGGQKREADTPKV